MKLQKLRVLSGWIVRLCVLMLVQFGGGQAFAQEVAPAEGTPSAETGTTSEGTAARTEGGAGAAGEGTGGGTAPTPPTPPPPVGELEDDNDLSEVIDPPDATPYRFDNEAMQSVRIWSCDDEITQVDPAAILMEGPEWQFKVVARTETYVQIQFYKFTGTEESDHLNSTYVGTDAAPKRWCVQSEDVAVHVVEARVQDAHLGYGALVIPIRIRPEYWGDPERRHEVDTDLNIAGTASLYGEVGPRGRFVLGGLLLFGVSAVEFEHTYAGDAEASDITRLAWTVGAGLFTRKGPVTISLLCGADFLVRRNKPETDSWLHNRLPWFGLSIGLAGDPMSPDGQEN